jgi:hypothetical protein
VRDCRDIGMSAPEGVALLEPPALHRAAPLGSRDLGPYGLVVPLKSVWIRAPVNPRAPREREIL